MNAIYDVMAKESGRYRVNSPEHTSWVELVAEAEDALDAPVDHIHAVVYEPDGEANVCHLDRDGAPKGPQVIMMTEEDWANPARFDTISLDIWH